MNPHGQPLPSVPSTDSLSSFDSNLDDDTEDRRQSTSSRDRRANTSRQRWSRTERVDPWAGVTLRTGRFVTVTSSDMDFTSVHGGNLSRAGQDTQNSTNMDMTTAQGGIVARRGDNTNTNGSMPMEFTRTHGGVGSASQHTQGSMSMEFTAAYGGIVPSSRTGQLRDVSEEMGGSDRSGRRRGAREGAGSDGAGRESGIGASVNGARGSGSMSATASAHDIFDLDHYHSLPTDFDRDAYHTSIFGPKKEFFPPGYWKKRGKAGPGMGSPSSVGSGSSGGGRKRRRGEYSPPRAEFANKQHTTRSKTARKRQEERERRRRGDSVQSEEVEEVEEVEAFDLEAATAPGPSRLGREVFAPGDYDVESGGAANNNFNQLHSAGGSLRSRSPGGPPSFRGQAERYPLSIFASSPSSNQQAAESSNRRRTSFAAAPSRHSEAERRSPSIFSTSDDGMGEAVDGVEVQEEDDRWLGSRQRSSSDQDEPRGQRPAEASRSRESNSQHASPSRSAVNSNSPAPAAPQVMVSPPTIGDLAAVAAGQQVNDQSLAGTLALQVVDADIDMDTSELAAGNANAMDIDSPGDLTDASRMLSAGSDTGSSVGDSSRPGSPANRSTNTAGSVRGRLIPSGPLTLQPGEGRSRSPSSSPGPAPISSRMAEVEEINPDDAQNADTSTTAAAGVYASSDGVNLQEKQMQSSGELYLELFQCPARDFVCAVHKRAAEPPVHASGPGDAPSPDRTSVLEAILMDIQAFKHGDDRKKEIVVSSRIMWYRTRPQLFFEAIERYTFRKVSSRILPPSFYSILTAKVEFQNLRSEPACQHPLSTDRLRDCFFGFATQLDLVVRSSVDGMYQRRGDEGVVKELCRHFIPRFEEHYPAFCTDGLNGHGSPPRFDVRPRDESVSGYNGDLELTAVLDDLGTALLDTAAAWKIFVASWHWYDLPNARGFGTPGPVCENLNIEINRFVRALKAVSVYPAQSVMLINNKAASPYAV